MIKQLATDLRLLFKTKRNLELSCVVRQQWKNNNKTLIIIHIYFEVFIVKWLQSDFTNKWSLKTNSLTLTLDLPTSRRISHRNSIGKQKEGSKVVKFPWSSTRVKKHQNVFREEGKEEGQTLFLKFIKGPVISIFFVCSPISSLLSFIDILKYDRVSQWNHK